MVITGNEFEFKYQIAFLTENLWSLSPKSQFSNLPRSLFADFTPFWPISLTSLRLSLENCDILQFDYCYIFTTFCVGGKLSILNVSEYLRSLCISKEVLEDPLKAI